MTCSTEIAGAPGLMAARTRFREMTIDHEYYKAARLDLQEKLVTHRMGLVVGPSGVGKERLVRNEVRRLNKPIVDDRGSLRAISFTAPSPQRGSFVWTAFWHRWLEALDDPLPECKVNRELKRDRLVEGVLTHARRGSVDALRNAAFAATRDRGVEVVFIDEAANLVPKERARTLRDQLDVLRDLTDSGCCRIVLAATPRILEPLNLSGELARRIGDVFFRRYADARARSREYKCFASVVKTLVDGLPEASRSALKGHLRLLHAGSLGCVGNLHDWVDRAIVRCLREQKQILDFRHFEATVLSDAGLKILRKEAMVGDEKFHELSARTFGGLLDASKGAAKAPVAAAASSSPSVSGTRVRCRPGTPKPRRHAVP